VSQPPSDAPDSAPNADTEEPPDVATTDPGAADGAELEPVDLAACRAGTPDWLPLPEASGAARLSKGRYIVVADSGNEGRALIVDESQGTSTAIALPLGEGAGDDLEGLDVSPDGRLFGVTSAGWLRAWRIEGDLATLVLGPVAVSDDADWCCGAFQVNCGPNYEGFCLHPEPTQAFSDGCEGWLVSKAKGELVCLRQEGESYRADPSVRHPVAPQNQLSGCAYEPTPPYRLVVAANVYSGDRLWEVGEDDMEQLPETGAGNQESVLGLEGDLNWSNIDSSRRQTITIAATPNAVVYASDVSWAGTLRVRAGYAVDRVLLYATSTSPCGRQPVHGRTVALTGAFCVFAQRGATAAP
jgi:hypothetical protein